MRRITAAATALILIIAGSYAIASLSSDGSPGDIGAVVGPTVDPQLDEVNRLIGVFEQRIAANTDALDYLTLGGFYLDRARLIGNLDDYRRANEVLEAGLEVAPEYDAAMRLLAAGFLAVHRFEDALAITDSLLSSDPLDPSSLLVATDANIELGRTDLAAVTLDRVSLLAPQDPALTVRRAELAHLDGAQEQAVDYATRAHIQAEDLGIEGRKLAFYSLFEADLFTDLGQYRNAESLARSALAAAPDWAEAHAALAGILAAQGRRDAAAEAYTAALALLPDDPEWLASRADLLTTLGDATLLQLQTWNERSRYWLPKTR